MVVPITERSSLTVSGSPWRACRIKLLTTLPSFICIRGPKVLNILATLTSTPSCRKRKKNCYYLNKCLSSWKCKLTLPCPKAFLRISLTDVISTVFSPWNTSNLSSTLPETVVHTARKFTLVLSSCNANSKSLLEQLMISAHRYSSWKKT